MGVTTAPLAFQAEAVAAAVGVGDAAFGVGGAAFGVGDAAVGVGGAAVGVGDAAIGVGDAAVGVGDAVVGVGEAAVGVGGSAPSPATCRTEWLAKTAGATDAAAKTTSIARTQRVMAWKVTMVTGGWAGRTQRGGHGARCDAAGGREWSPLVDGWRCSGASAAPYLAKAPATDGRARAGGGAAAGARAVAPASAASGARKTGRIGVAAPRGGPTRVAPHAGAGGGHLPRRGGLPRARQALGIPAAHVDRRGAPPRAGAHGKSRYKCTPGASRADGVGCRHRGMPRPAHGGRSQSVTAG